MVLPIQPLVKMGLLQVSLHPRYKMIDGTRLQCYDDGKNTETDQGDGAGSGDHFLLLLWLLLQLPPTPATNPHLAPTPAALNLGSS